MKPSQKKMSDDTPLIVVRIASEQDVVLARQRTRQLADLLGFASQDQVALATAVSEMARNVYQYARSGQIEFRIDLQSRPQFFSIHVHDRGPGIEKLDQVLEGAIKSQTGMGVGLIGTRRLTERFEISSQPGQGTAITFGKSRPLHLAPIDLRAIGDIAARMGGAPMPQGSDEMRTIERDLRGSLEQLQGREAELQRRSEELTRLNVELEETNRGVVALYAELEEKAAALRRADELKSRFLSHVSHEFRTPVNSVMALARLLLRRADGDLTPEQEKQVAFISKAAEGLAEMVDDLLDLAKMEAGKIELRPSEFELSQAFGAVRALMRPLATNEAVILTFVDPPQGLTLKADEAKLGQILRNLVSNALKFTEAGEVRVQASHDAASDMVSIDVVDTGIGLAPENQELIFQEFSQVSNPLQRAVKGTGLGLPLSRKLAELMGGTLVVTSTLGSGSTFTFRVPRSAGSKPDSPASAVESEATILIVDDEEAARYVCGRLFQGSRSRILESTGLEAAERARFERPDLIILDLMMPGRTGFEVLEDLHSHPITANIPVIIHTSKVITPADRQRLRDLPAGILPKSGRDRKGALQKIRQILRDESLFMNEPEFAASDEKGE